MKYGDLVSVIVATYNHEDYIVECLRAACNQTYPNVEVIVCDDCSSDNTFNLITEFSLCYSGPTNLRLYENETNLGAIGNYQKCISLAKGEIIVEQDGDDVPLPNRVEEIVKCFFKDHEVKGIFSNAFYTDENGIDHGLYFNKRPSFVSTLKEFEECKFSFSHIFEPYVWMLGSTGAFSRELYTQFDEMDPRARHEDGVFSFRALLLGKLEYIDIPLVRYRRHSNAVSAPENFKGRIKLLKTEYYYFKQQYNDALKQGVSDKVLSNIRVYKRISYIKSKVFGIPILGEWILKFLLFLSHLNRKL